MKAGIELDLMFDSVKEFIRAVRPVNELLSFLKSVNKEFKKHVKIQKQKQLNKIEESKTNDLDSSSSDYDFNLCGICFELPMEVVLECSHSFCERCIHDWRKKHNTCPLCRDEK
jgi:hypothetical protein